MEILHFKEFDDAESVDTNAVWMFSLVIGGYRASFGWKQLSWECQISIATYLRGYLPSYQVV